jgi:type IV pilus assembly protein PilB
MNSVATANLLGITGIARRLVLDGALEESVARNALDAATLERKPIANYLRERKLVTPAQLAAANSIEFGMPMVDPAAMDQSQTALKLVNDELINKHHVLPLFKRGGRLFVGMSDPTNTAALDEIKFHTNLVVEPILIDEETIKRTLEQWMASQDSLGSIIDDSEGLDNLDVSSGDDDAIGDSGIDAKGDDTPVVKFINKVLIDAIRRGASDIHFEPYETDYRVRLRIDGILKQVA